MTDDSALSKSQRKKARRKQRHQSERQAHRDLGAIALDAVDLVMAAAEEAMVDRQGRVGLDIALPADSEAQFVRKRANEALMAAEWLNDVRLTLWTAHDGGSALTDAGRQFGRELRVERLVR